jgi:phospholipase C
VNVEHVFVLMLENHSFDNMFGFSGIPAIEHATPANSNTYAGQVYTAVSPAPPSMPTDPGHEFVDVLEQLCGPGTTHTPWEPYPRPITNSGFVANYATSASEIAHGSPDLPTPAEYPTIMQCFDTPTQLPVLYQLATEFAICDHWFASIPGPTWPNRFFVHGASSGGWADSPSSANIARWEVGAGFVYPSGSSIFDALARAGKQWRVYVDESGPLLGGVPQVAALKGIKYGLDTHPFSGFQSELKGAYPYTYTFIEPNYGDIADGSFAGGSSQHPRDGVAGGEALIKATYEAIRSSPLWNSSLLVITYDEHGGFYDSCQPGPAPPPNDGSPNELSINASGFMFDQYGVRVPAVVVSPLIPRGTVDHTTYDHASVPATLERLFNLTPLTQRDAQANSVLGLLSLSAPRSDSPATLSASPPVPTSVTPVPNDQPLPASGNVHGALDILLKTDLELSGGDPAPVRERFAKIRTVGDARAYAQEVRTRVRDSRGNRPR